MLPLLNNVISLSAGIEDQYGWTLFMNEDGHVKNIFPENPLAFMFLFQRPNRWGNHDLSVSTELHVQDDLGYAQFIVLNDENEDTIRLEYVPEKQWKKCLVPAEEKFNNDFFSLTGDKKLFVEYPKPIDGSYMDTGEIMFPLSNVKKVGEPTTFTTDNCRFFLKYHIDEVRKVAPVGANAYKICGDVSPGDLVEVPVQFYTVTPITDKRILKRGEVMDNLDLLLEINNVMLTV